MPSKHDGDRAARGGSGLREPTSFRLPPQPNDAMDQVLRNYLASHRKAINAAALRIARDIANPDDTDRDARRLVSEARAALHKALGNALDAGPVEGWPLGTAGEVCVVVRVPNRGQASMGKLGVSAARLATSGMIPCPDDWPQDHPPALEFVEHLHRMIFPEPEGPRIVEADLGGRVEIGKRNAAAAYILTELPDGEIWLRPLEPAESGKV